MQCTIDEFTCLLPERLISNAFYSRISRFMTLVCALLNTSLCRTTIFCRAHWANHITRDCPQSNEALDKPTLAKHKTNQHSATNQHFFEWIDRSHKASSFRKHILLRNHTYHDKIAAEKGCQEESSVWGSEPGIQLLAQVHMHTATYCDSTSDVAGELLRTVFFVPYLGRIVIVEKIQLLQS